MLAQILCGAFRDTSETCESQRGRELFYTGKWSWRRVAHVSDTSYSAGAERQSQS